MNRVATTIVLAALLALAFALPLAPAAEAQTPAATVKDDGGNVVLQSFTGGELLAPDQGASDGDIPAEDAGARMMWYPGKAAFRAGEVGVLGDKEDAWNEVNVGTRSVAFGADTKASGDESTAMGRETTASGSRATAMGDRTTAATDNSLSLGKCNSANQSDDNTLLVVGNGVAFGFSCDTNTDALVLDKAGNLEIAGDYKTTGGDLTLDPGSGNELVLNNQSTASSGSLLAIDGSGNVVEASSTTLGDVGGGGGSSSELVTSGNGDTAFQVVDGGSDVSNAGSSIDAPNVVGGHPDNNTTGGPTGAFIGGGGSDGSKNTVSANFTTIGGGQGNEASGADATVGGGLDNMASGERATVPGGQSNEASGDNATAMGRETTASGSRATAMGDRTTAATDNSLSLGKCNSANQSDDNTLLVVGNGVAFGFSCDTNTDALVLDKAGNLEIAGTLTENSDRRLKTDIDPLSEGVLGALGEIDPVRYRFKNEQTHPSGEQIGLIAQEVRAHFPELVREGADGMLSLAYPKLTAVLLKGLQEQQSELERQKATIDSLKRQVRRIEAVEKRLASLEADRTPSTAGWAGGLPLRGLGVLLVGGLLGAGLLALRRR